MEEINQLLEELKPVDFSNNITILKSIVSKAYVPLEINNKVEYSDIKTLFGDITNEFVDIYKKLLKNDYQEKRNTIVKKKDQILKKVISKLREKGFKVFELDQYTNKNYIVEKNSKKIYTFIRNENTYIDFNDYQDIVKDNNINNSDLNKLLSDYKYNIVFLENVKTKKIREDINKKLKIVIPKIEKIFGDNDIKIERTFSNNEIIIYKTSNSNMLKKALGNNNKGSIEKLVKKLVDIEKYETSKMLFNNDLTKSVQDFMKDMIEPCLKLIDYQNRKFSVDNIDPEFRAKFTESTPEYVDPFQYPYYESNNKEYKTYDFVNSYLRYLIEKLNKKNKNEIDFIINILIRTIYQYKTVKGGSRTTYIDMIKSFITFTKLKNEYFIKTLIKNLDDYLYVINSLGKTDTVDYITYILNEFFSGFLSSFNKSNIEIIDKEENEEPITSINFDEEVNKITNELIKNENLKKEQLNLKEQLKNTNDVVEMKNIQSKIENIQKKLGIVKIEQVKKEKTEEDIKLEMITKYTEILDDLQDKLQQNRREFKVGHILRPEYEKNMEKIKKDIDKYEKIKQEFNVQKYKKEMNKKVNHHKIVFDYRPDYEEPEDIVLHPSAIDRKEDAKMKKLMKNKLIKELFKEDESKKFESRFEKFAVIINNTLQNTLEKIDMKELKPLRSVFEKYIRELSKKLYNHNIMIKADQNKPFNLVYYPFLQKMLVTYFVIHNLISKSGKNIPIQIKTKKRTFNGLFEEVRNKKVHIFDSKQLKNLMIPIDYIEDIILKSSDDKYKEIKEKIKTDKKACIYLEKLLLNEERNKNMLSKEKFNENMKNGLFDMLFEVYTNKVGKVTYTKELFPEIFIDGEYENINKEIFNKVFDIIRKNKKLGFTYKVKIEKSLILKKKEEDYEKIKLKLYEYTKELISQLQLLEDGDVSLIQLVSLKKQNMTKELDSYMKYSLKSNYEDILKFSLYYQVNENDHPSEEYLKIKDDMIKKYEFEMNKYNVSFPDILVNYRRLYETKERYITTLMDIHKKLTSTTKIIQKKGKVDIETKRETFDFLKNKIGINDIQMEKYKKREDFVKIVDTFAEDIKPFNKNLNDEMRKVNYMKKFYDNIMNKKYITSFDLGTLYDSKVNLLTTIFNKDNVNYKLTNCVSMVKQMDPNECSYCPYKNDNRKLIHNHILETHKNGIEKYVEIENVYDPTARVELRMPKVVKVNEKVKKVEPLKVNNIDCIINLYNENKHLYINYIKSSDDRMYKFHKVVMRKVNEIRNDMEIKLNENKNDIKKIQEEAYKIVKIITKKELARNSPAGKRFNTRVKMILNKTNEPRVLINKFVEEAFRQFTKKVTLKEYRKYCNDINKIISKNILESLKYNINYETLMNEYNFENLDEKYLYLTVNNKDDLKNIIENVHKNSIIQDRQLRCYSSTKDMLMILENLLKGSNSGLIKNMFSYESIKVDKKISYQLPYVKSHFSVYLMLKYIVKEQLKDVRKTMDNSYENNKSKNFKLPYFFDLIQKPQKNDKGDIVKISSLRSELIDNEEYIDNSEWTTNFTEEDKKLILQLIKKYRYLALSITNYFTKKEINEKKYQEKLLKKLIIDLMSIQHYTMKDFMKNYLDIILYEQKYALKNKRTKQEEKKFFEEQKFNFVDTLLENEEQREDTEEVKENVEQNKEKVKKISFDFPISDLDEARIVKEFNELQD